MDMTKKHKQIICGIVLLCLTLILVIFLGKKSASAERTAMDTVQDYLIENNVSFRSLTVSEQIITAELISQGTERCTLEDVKAIQALNEALQCDERLNEIMGLQVIIYDINNEKIYDIYTAKDHAKNDETQEIATLYHAILEEMIKEKAVDLIKDYQCEVKDIVYTVQDTGISKLEIKVEVPKENIISMLDLSIADDQRMDEFYKDGLSQFILNLQDEDGNNFLYIAIDFVEHELNTWVSPEAEKDFIRLHSPINAIN